MNTSPPAIFTFSKEKKHALIINQVSIEINSTTTTTNKNKVKVMIFLN